MKYLIPIFYQIPADIVWWEIVMSVGGVSAMVAVATELWCFLPRQRSANVLIAVGAECR